MKQFNRFLFSLGLMAFGLCAFAAPVLAHNDSRDLVIANQVDQIEPAQDQNAQLVALCILPVEMHLMRYAALDSEPAYGVYLVSMGQHQAGLRGGLFSRHTLDGRIALVSRGSSFSGLQLRSLSACANDSGPAMLHTRKRDTRLAVHYSAGLSG